MLLADAVAVVHGAAVVLMLTGAVVALWRPRVLWVHLPVCLAILAVNRAGEPCPLTELELSLRAQAGAAAYDGGYLGHYVLAPMGLEVASPSVQAGVYTVAIAPNAVALGLLALRTRRRRTVVTRVLSGRARRAATPGDDQSKECSGPGNAPPRTSSANSRVARSSSVRRSA